MERGWETVRVSGSSEFTRQAWIATTAHGLKAIGHQRPAIGKQRRKSVRASNSAAALDAPSRQHPNPVKKQGGIVEHADSVGERVRRSSAIRERQLVAAFDKALGDGKVPAQLARPNARADGRQKGLGVRGRATDSMFASTT